MSTTSTTPTTPLAVRPKEAARMLNISDRTLFNLIKSGRLPATKIGSGRAGAVLISVAAIEAFLRGDDAKGGAQ